MLSLMSLGILGTVTWILEHMSARIQQIAEDAALFPDLMEPDRNPVSFLWAIVVILWLTLEWATMTGRIVWR